MEDFVGKVRWIAIGPSTILQQLGSDGEWHDLDIVTPQQPESVCIPINPELLKH